MSKVQALLSLSSKWNLKKNLASVFSELLGASRPIHSEAMFRENDEARMRRQQAKHMRIGMVYSTLSLQEATKLFLRLGSVSIL